MLQRRLLPERVLAMGLLPWGLLAFGVTLIVTRSTLFLPLRQALKPRTKWGWVLFKCPMCFGFWVGVLLGLLGAWASSFPAGWPLWLRLWAQGAISSATCWILHLICGRLLQGVSPQALGADEEPGQADKGS